MEIRRLDAEAESCAAERRRIQMHKAEFMLVVHKKNVLLLEQEAEMGHLNRQRALIQNELAIEESSIQALADEKKRGAQLAAEQKLYEILRQEAAIMEHYESEMDTLEGLQIAEAVIEHCDSQDTEKAKTEETSRSDCRLLNYFVGPSLGQPKILEIMGLDEAAGLLGVSSESIITFSIDQAIGTLRKMKNLGLAYNPAFIRDVLQNEDFKKKYFTHDDRTVFQIPTSTRAIGAPTTVNIHEMHQRVLDMLHLGVSVDYLVPKLCELSSPDAAMKTSSTPSLEYCTPQQKRKLEEIVAAVVANSPAIASLVFGSPSAEPTKMCEDESYNSHEPKSKRQRDV